MARSIGIHSIAISFPQQVRTNDYWRKHYPDLLARATQKSLAKAFEPTNPDRSEGLEGWVREMQPYLSDPFRGSVERRIISGDESSLTLEQNAATEVLKVAGLAPEEIDLMIVGSMFPEHVGMGNAAFLAGRLGLQGAAWNINSMCASPMVALQTACALIRSGEYRNVLVVTSCTYSRVFHESRTLSFSMGDGAGAFIVDRLPDNQGVLGTKVVHSGESCGTFFTELVIDEQGQPTMRARAGKDAGKRAPYLFLKYFRECCAGALQAAGVTIEQIDFFICYTATAWYSQTCAKELGFEPERTIDIYPQYGNISAASIPVNLYYATALGKMRPNDLVLVYNHGFVASASAVVMRWGDVKLGSAPTPAANLIR